MQNNYFSGGTFWKNANILPEKATSILTLTDETGSNVEFEYLDGLE